MGTGDYCIDGWFKNTMPVNTSTTHNQRLFDLGDNGCRIFFKNGQIKAQTGSSTQMTYSPGADFGTDAWHHFALQRESGTTKFFLGGVQRTSISDTQNHATTACKIGGYGGSDTDSYKFQGYISDFRVVKGATAHGYSSNSGSINLTASNANVSFATDADYVVASSEDFTIEAWVYTPSSFALNNTKWRHIYFCGTNGKLSFAYDTAGKPILYDNTSTILLAGTASTASTWEHITFTRSSGTIKFYRNGVEDGSTSSNIALGDNTNTHYIGAYSATSGSLGGYISNFRFVIGTGVYTGAFSPGSALTANGGTYSHTTNVNTSFTASHTVMLTGQSSSSVTDASAKNKTLTLGNSAAASANSPFIDVPTSKSTAITGTVLLTCQQSTGDFTDASASNHAISQGASGTVLATRHQPY